MPGRRARRVRASHKITVAFLGTGVHLTGDLVDLSITGVLVRSSLSPPPGTLGRVGITLGSETIRAVAAVRRLVAGIGVALEFKNMASRDRGLLNRLLLRLGKEITS